MKPFKILLFAILTLVLPFLLYFIQLLTILTLKDILMDWQLWYFVSLVIGIVYLISLWFFLNEIFNMGSAFLSSLCVISAFIGFGFFMLDLYSYCCP